MKIFRILASAVSLGLLASAAHAGDPKEDVSGQVRAFYKFYLHALNSEGDPLTSEHATLKRYVSERFLKKIDRARKIEGGLEADPFICAQDFDKAWEKNIRLKDVDVENDKATVQVELSGGQMSPHRLGLKLVASEGAWKIDEIKDADAR